MYNIHLNDAGMIQVENGTKLKIGIHKNLDYD